MKLPQLLSQYLYQFRKLDLPGIGTFTLDATAVIPQESDRTGQVPATGISFRNANITLADDNLITFIKDHTGKMKSLAAADLDFYLTTGRQLLNIGKPFYLEGIGTLIKNKEGQFEFTPGDYLVARLEEHGHQDRRSAAAGGHEEQTREESRAVTGNSRQAILLLGLIAGLVIVGWGGYYLYKRNTYVEPTAENRATVIPDTVVRKTTDTTARAVADTTHPAATPGNLAKTDTAKADATAAKPAPTAPVALHEPVPGPGETLFRFVILQTNNKGHALRRYNQLLGYQLNIHMYQKDSAFFKLYFPIAAPLRDTARIKDSLADVYAARVTIEQ
ncbi:MAG TPA: hypothetical protein VHE54_11790 [Puia sp.]|nr:hypothetical protein [Puia sp.]